MRVLALDTTAREGSVALTENERVVLERAGDPARPHAERMPGDLIGALDEAGWNVASVDAFAVVAGPGSFTGIRIGIATMQGLAFVHQRRLFAISALDALAYTCAAGRDGGVHVGAWVDAHRHEVYSALYVVRDGQSVKPDRIAPLESASVGSPAAVLVRWSALVPHIDVLVGDGASAYAAVIGGAARIAPRPMLAGAAALIASARARTSEAADPALVQPIYIRRPDVEVTRELARGTR
jgi:tRNA threonylcarbamoyladenosine biosynthesis protein TsaB